MILGWDHGWSSLGDVCASGTEAIYPESATKSDASREGRQGDASREDGHGRPQHLDLFTIHRSIDDFAQRRDAARQKLSEVSRDRVLFCVRGCLHGCGHEIAGRRKHRPGSTSPSTCINSFFSLVFFFYSLSFPHPLIFLFVCHVRVFVHVCSIYQSSLKSSPEYTCK